MSKVERIIGRKINQVRHRSHLTQIEFADEIHVHPSYIGPLEKGRKVPSFHTLLRVADRFQIPVYEFFLESDPASVDPLLELNLLLSSCKPEEQQMVLDLARSVLKNMERKRGK